MLFWAGKREGGSIFFFLQVDRRGLGVLGEFL